MRNISRWQQLIIYVLADYIHEKYFYMTIINYLRFSRLYEEYFYMTTVNYLRFCRLHEKYFWMTTVIYLRFNRLHEECFYRWQQLIIYVFEDYMRFTPDDCVIIWSSFFSKRSSVYILYDCWYVITFVITYQTIYEHLRATFNASCRY